MAQRINQVASFANGLVRAEVDWNDGNGNMSRFRVYNDSDFAAFMYAKLDPPINGYSEIGVDAPAKQMFQNVLPSNTAKYTKVIDPDDGSVSWSLIGISIFCRWPA